jgi:hypothetical protein
MTCFRLNMPSMLCMHVLLYIKQVLRKAIVCVGMCILICVCGHINLSNLCMCQSGYKDRHRCQLYMLHATKAVLREVVYHLVCLRFTLHWGQPRRWLHWRLSCRNWRLHRCRQWFVNRWSSLCAHRRRLIIDWWLYMWLTTSSPCTFCLRPRPTTATWFRLTLISICLRTEPLRIISASHRILL